MISNNLGLELHMRGHYDEAATLFDQALALWKPGDDPAKRADTLLNRGHLDRRPGRGGAGPRAVQAALALFRQAKDLNNQRPPP